MRERSAATNCVILMVYFDVTNTCQEPFFTASTCPRNYRKTWDISPGKCTSILGSGAYAMSFQSKIPKNMHFSPHFLARKNLARSVALHCTLIPIESALQPCNNQHGGGR